MKTKISLAFFALLLSTFVISQNTTIELSFEAEYDGENVVLDTIIIENLSQGGVATLYYPDDEFILTITDIDDKQSVEENNFSVSQNYPNPFNHQTQVNLYLPEKENIIITVHDILGRELASFKNTLKRGNHTFTFSPGNDKYYLLTVTGKRSSKTIKMLNMGNDLLSNQQCQIIYTAFHEVSSKLKSLKSIKEFVFEIGDTLRFTGYSNTPFAIPGTDVIMDAPEVDTDYTFEILEGIPCPGTPTVTYDGQIYKTVQIGDQCWFKENLNVGTMIPGDQVVADNGILEKYCYNDEPDSCAKYGGLYQWDEMMQYTTTQGVQGICPEGWHLPTDFFYPEADWCVMMQFIDPTVECMAFNAWTGTDIGVRMKSIIGWNFNGNGTNTHGFTAIPAGIRNSTFFNHIGNKAFFWSSSQGAVDGAWGLTIEYNNERIIRFNYYKFASFSVRCIKDE